MQLILGESGDFSKGGGLSSPGEEAKNDARRQPSVNGGGLPPPISFSAPNAVSKRVAYPYADKNGGAGGPADAGGAGGTAGGARGLKRVASTRIAAKATVSNAFRR